MRVAYFDLGFSAEDYSVQPRRYGGGAVVGRYLKEESDLDLHVFAPSEAFANVNVDTERADRCVGMPDDLCKALREGLPVDHVLRHFPAFDLVLHGHTCFAPQRGAYRGPICHWSGFDGKAGHPHNDYALFYNDTFTPQFGERAKYVRIGKPVPAQCPTRVIGDYVVQVSRHDAHMNSVALAQQCLTHGVKGIFAGPIHEGCRLMDYIDGKTTTYLGEIDEARKLELYRNARLCGLLFNWSAPFNQTIIEAQGQGCPIYVNQCGPFLERYLKHGVNGFRADGGLPMDIRDAFDLAVDIDPKQCWSAAREYDVSVMVTSFKKAFKEIVQEWNR